MPRTRQPNRIPRKGRPPDGSIVPKDVAGGRLLPVPDFARRIKTPEDGDPGNRFKFENVTKLYESWSGYARSQNAEPGSKISFGDDLEAKGYARDKVTKGERVIRGIRLKVRDTGEGN